MELAGALEVLPDLGGDRVDQGRGGDRLHLEACGVLGLHPAAEADRVEDERHLVRRL
jgi:hypothetical protein